MPGDSPTAYNPRIVRRLVGPLVAALALGGTASAQTRPDLTGLWISQAADISVLLLPGEEVVLTPYGAERYKKVDMANSPSYRCSSPAARASSTKRGGASAACGVASRSALLGTAPGSAANTAAARATHAALPITLRNACTVCTVARPPPSSRVAFNHTPSHTPGGGLDCLAHHHPGAGHTHGRALVEDLKLHTGSERHWRRRAAYALGRRITLPLAALLLAAALLPACQARPPYVVENCTPDLGSRSVARVWDEELMSLIR